MPKDIYWVCVFQIAPTDLDAFKAVVRPLVEMTRQEAGSLAFEYNASPDKSSIHIIEHYQDSAAVMHHVTQTFSQFAAAFTALASVKSFVF